VSGAGLAGRLGAAALRLSLSARGRRSAADGKTFIVGFPGETEEDFAFLLDWLKEARLARAGCFKYEAVEGATANALADAVPEEVKEERWHRFMAAQQEVSRAVTAARVGRSIDVIVDEMDGDRAVGRSKWDAPEIDGAVHLDGATALKPGAMVQARVTRADAYDLWAEVATSHR
jgi:ribosomal protein S12 methylthiotransferase